MKEFLKRYEIRPRENKEEQNMNKQETAMAKKKRNRRNPCNRVRYTGITATTTAGTAGAARAARPALSLQ